jgi:hypothetical protein
VESEIALQMDSRNNFLVLPSQHQPLPVSLSSLAGLPKSVATEELQALETWAIFGGKTMREIGCGQQRAAERIVAECNGHKIFGIFRQ